MGGNALKNTETHRVTTEELTLVTLLVEKHLINIDNNVMITPVKFYRNKPDHGDIDIVVSSRNRHFICDYLRSRKEHCHEVFRNGPYASLDYPVPGTDKRVQVDIIRMPLEDHDFAARYFHYNDLGNLIGRIAHRMGFKFGHRGLEYNLRFDTNHIRNMTVTRDWDRALAFLGFNPYTWRQGFDNLEDIFKYVAASEYFDPTMFDLELRSHRERVRDRKRSTYTGFLRWVEDNKPARGAEIDPEYMLIKAREWWPEFSKELDNSLEYVKMSNEVKDKFNGLIVSEITNLEGKELGEFMKYLRQERTKEEQVRFYYDMTEQQIRDHIASAYQDWINE